MTSHSTISIIIPAYQHAHTLTACLESVFAQTVPPFEVIVVDDGSTDDTPRVLEMFLDRGVRVIRQENRGGNAARNRGFNASSGVLVLFLDADIVMRNDMLEILANALEKHSSAAYAYSAFRFGWKRFSSYRFSSNLLRRMNYIHTSALIRREAFPRFDETLKRFQDWDLWLTILERGGEGIYVEEELFRALSDTKRRGISSWRPSWMYRIPWKRFGWMPKSVRDYEEARRIVLLKHHLWT